MNEEILMESERILNELDRIKKFGTKYNVALPQEESRILDEIQDLIILIQLFLCTVYLQKI